jgi:hypothetical protein
MGQKIVREKQGTNRSSTEVRKSTNSATSASRKGRRRPVPMTPRLKLAVGEPWPDDVSAHIARAGVASRARRDRAAEALVYSAVTLLFALAGWAMRVHDREVLCQIVRVDKAGLGFAGAWVGGTAVLRILAKLGQAANQQEDRDE